VNALIPWFLNGTLPDTERAQVEGLLRESPEAEAELKMWRAVQLHVRTQPEAAPGADFGWQRLRRDLKREQRRGSQVKWRVAAAASVLVVLGLQSVILMRQESVTRYEPLSGSLAIPADAWRVQVRFADSAAMADISALLMRLDARVISGPSALGIYELVLPREAASDAQALRTRLAAEPLLLQVVVAP
jgi:anti-sigma factor RsiW